EPRRCTILAYHADFVWLDTGVPGTPISTRTDKVDFNVIRTPEQIAAEEREKAIEEMVALVTKGQDYSVQAETGTSTADYVRDACKQLYVGGYRKQENNDAKA
ncbi:hypothetical protein ACPF8X_37520, partial [Streptomyces sp. G35A]